MSAVSGISALQRGSIARAVVTLERAFSPDPMFAWLFPDPAARPAALRRLLRVPVEYGVRYGRVTQSHGARVTCVNPAILDRSFAGREFDASFLDDLPPAIDPCGERGEFHSFAYQGPMFNRPIDVELGVIVERDGFVFADLLIA